MYPPNQLEFICVEVFNFRAIQYIGLLHLLCHLNSKGGVKHQFLLHKKNEIGAL
jgi:hypothetical protein